ncbi:DUF732 domain-containing protein [Dietzia psychralcaliphila]|uniref:DUF732 domain-containing protein n=1 Tax=Dietzia psychralcaliphila TaxID=139021 RepID=A0AAD0JRY9_9ACTN|nr:DUF732 domain-containing protein [Dietzia psychralcaliphila]AWH96757.1 hypothetical protein A6048_16125 [Dietzia psychralcaliphila]PTM89398.1 uncharacterized protein DUF732 [Dietzia psychralcaliphila]
MTARAHRAAQATRRTPATRPGRRRAVAAASGFAALALVLGACGEEGTAEDAVGDATSAVGSVAAEATSAVGDATDGDGATTGEQPAPDRTGENGGDDRAPDEQFLSEIRTVGVDAEDEQAYLTRGRDACASLDGDMGYVDVVRQYNDAHPDAPVTEAPVVVAAAVRAFCSQHLPQVGQGG